MFVIVSILPYVHDTFRPTKPGKFILKKNYWGAFESVCITYSCTRYAYNQVMTDGRMSKQVPVLRRLVIY